MTTRASAGVAAAQLPHEAPDARVPGGEAVVVDQVLPDGHRVAAARQRLGDHLAVRLAGARARRAPGRRRWPESVDTPPGNGRFCGPESVDTSRNGRFCSAFAWPPATRAPGCPRPADSRSPSRDAHRSPPRSAAAAIPSARAPGLAAASRCPRRCSSRRGTKVPRLRQRLGRRQLMAGFAVSINGWIWVSTEGREALVRQRESRLRSRATASRSNAVSFLRVGGASGPPVGAPAP